MRKLLLSLLFGIISIATWAQATISGQVTASSGEPLAYANVLLLNPLDSALLQGQLTDQTGVFSIKNCESGDYLLAITMVGYSPHYQRLRLTETRPFDVGVVQLYEAVEQMEEVVVQTKKPLFEQRMDRLVVNVQKSITSSGSTVLQVLERSPGVIVNRQNGSLGLNGKEGVMVAINGKVSRMPVASLLQMLEGMNAANIEAIELITNPPARYDAEGNAGIINIVMQKNEDYGTRANFSLTAGYGLAEKAGGSFNFDHRSARLSLYGNYAYFRNRTEETINNYWTLDLPGVRSHTLSISDRQPIINNHQAQLGLDYEVGQQTTLGALISGNANRWDMDATNAIRIENELVREGQHINDELNLWQHWMANIHLSHRFNEQQELRWDTDYLSYKNDNPSNHQFLFPQQTELGLLTEQVRVEKETPVQIWVSRADYRHQLNENLRWEAGIKGVRSSFTNDFLTEVREEDAWLREPTFSQRHNLEEYIAAVYTSWQWQLSEATRANLGLRYEYTDSRLSTPENPQLIDRQYGNLFPTFRFSHSFDKEKHLQFSYGRRITRPTFNDLAPFVLFTAPNLFVSGNPALQPALTDAIKLNYRWKNLLLSAQFNHQKEAIAAYQPHLEIENELYWAYAENMDFARTLTLMAVYSLNPAPWWSMQNTLMGNRQQVQADYLEKPLEETLFNFRYNLTQQFQLPGGFSLELSGYYQSPFLFFGISRQAALGALNLGIQKKFDDGSSLQFTLDDIFWTDIWDIENDVSSLGYVAGWSYYREPRVFKLTYTRSLGNRQLESRNRPRTGSSEEQRRVN
jgi:hypothetical protein